MRDSYGREINYIRISLTDQCNLRCLYCMPEGGPSGMESLANIKENFKRERFLTREELCRLVRCFAETGITRVRLTGGEPLLRPDLADLIRNFRKIPGIRSVTLTTNGTLLGERLPELVSAGLCGVNLSLDSLDEERYRRISGREHLDAVLQSLDEALRYPHLTVKLNCVPIRGINDADLPKLALLAKERDVSVRFIEMMPIGFGREFSPVREDEVKEMLQEALGVTLKPCAGTFGNGPARYYAAEGFRGRIGFISAVSHKFCSSCNRIRLTSSGILKTCLQYSYGCNLRDALQSGISDKALTALIRRTIYEKPACHHFGDLQPDPMDEKKTMSEIGG